MKTRTLVTMFFVAVLPLCACVADAGAPEGSTQDGDELTADSADATTPDAKDVAQASSYVGIPSNYVYQPSLGTLHDYCTSSPDEFPNPVGSNANFRGPCARHDMCLGAHTASQTCNNRLWSDMVSNCQFTYGALNPVRGACIDTAHVYWAAVTVHTHL